MISTNTIVILGVIAVAIAFLTTKTVYRVAALAATTRTLRLAETTQTSNRSVRFGRSPAFEWLPGIGAIRHAWRPPLSSNLNLETRTQGDYSKP